MEFSFWLVLGSCPAHRRQLTQKWDDLQALAACDAAEGASG
jgi:hypothetical protein